MERILNKLNPRQKEAVLNNETPLLVLAGAGSGKTTLLTAKFAYLLKAKYINPSNILAVTFTNKAANEMKERISKLTNISGNIPWICTFHSFGAKVLRKFITRLGYQSDFIIYDDKDQKNFIKKIIKNDLNLDEKVFTPNKVSYFINSCKNKGLSPDDLNMDNDYLNNNLKILYSHYQNKMRENNSVDFGDLLFLVYKLFNDDKDVLGYYRYLFEYILVDEYQDTNEIQYKIVKFLGKDKKGICVVGDDDQSIYGWRGATVENILNFEKDFQGAKIIKLEENYRSTSNILNAANRLISRNRRRKGKNLWTSKGTGEKITIFPAYDEYEEARFVVNKIKEINKFSDTAILYRTNAQSRVFEDELIKKGIPYLIVGGFKFFDRKEIKDIIAYLKLVDGSEDILSYERVINVPVRGIGNRSIFKLMEVVNREKITLFQVFEKVANNEVKFTSKIKNGIIEFYNILKKFRGLKDSMPLSDMVALLIDETNYLSLFENIDTIERENKIANLEELISSIKNFEKNNPEGTLTDYLDTVSLISSVDIENKGGNVSLMTIHAAKGLEFSYIFFVGLEDNVIPHMNSKNSEMEIEEERRLCYVAITRAKQKVFLSYCRNRSRGRFYQSNPPSPFLRDLPDELIEIEELIDRKKIEKIDENSEKSNIKTGMLVNHNKFGIGKVIALIGSGENRKGVIFFKKYGKKTLLLKKAPIQFL